MLSARQNNNQNSTDNNTSSNNTKNHQPLLLGFANSSFQSLGSIFGDSNWTEDAKNNNVPATHLLDNPWEEFLTGLNKIVEMGGNSYRFSVEWSSIEPNQGDYTMEGLKYVEAMINACKIRNIEPILTLHHFTEPLWFTKLGSFEKIENIDHFVNYCELIFKRFSKDVKWWCTINEPAVQAFSGYLYGQFPPHEFRLLPFTKTKAPQVLLNLLKAHVMVYQKAKNEWVDDPIQVGIVHNVLKFVPSNIPIPRLASYLTTIAHSLLMNFFSTGIFQYDDFRQSINETVPDAIKAFDFFGLNFYGTPVIGFSGPTHLPDQTMGDMYLSIDPIGFAKAIDEVAQFKKPILITETGFATKNEDDREECIQKYLAVIDQKREELEALKEQNKEDNACIIGIELWTLKPNYEWNEGYTKDFGLVNQDWSNRKSAAVYEDFIRSHLTTSRASSPSKTYTNTPYSFFLAENKSNNTTENPLVFTPESLPSLGKNNG